MNSSLHIMLTNPLFGNCAENMIMEFLKDNKLLEGLIKSVGNKRLLTEDE